MIRFYGEVELVIALMDGSDNYHISDRHCRISKDTAMHFAASNATKIHGVFAARFRTSEDVIDAILNYLESHKEFILKILKRINGTDSDSVTFSIPLSGAGFVVSADGRVFIANRIKVVLKEDENYRIGDKARGLFVASAYPVR